MGIAMGLAAAFCWGVGDFLAGQSTRRIGTYATLLLMQLIGFGLLTAYVGASGALAAGIASGPAAAWGWAALVGALNVLSMLALYRAFEIGVLALVAPIAASYGAITALLALAGGETIAPARGIGLLLTVAGVALAAAGGPSGAHPGADAPAGAPRHKRGLPWALAAALGFGVSFWLLGIKVQPALGPTLPVWVMRLCGAAGLGLGLLAVRAARGAGGGRAALPRGRDWWLVIGLGVLDTGAYLAHMAGLESGAGQVAVVSVLGSLFSAVTVALAWLFLRERLLPRQWAGIAVIFAGIALVSA